MAKANWLIVDPQTGNGNKSVTVKSQAEHTGRTARSTILTFKAANCADVTRNVIQAGKPEHVSIDETASATKEGKTLTISGISNSAKLTFTLGTGNLAITLPSNYTANSVSTANGASITGDPGAVAAYNFAIAIKVPANTTPAAQTKQLIVTDGAGNSDTCQITLAAGDAYLRVTLGDINLDYQGTPKSVDVESNTSWSVV